MAGQMGRLSNLFEVWLGFNNLGPNASAVLDFVASGASCWLGVRMVP